MCALGLYLAFLLLEDMIIGNYSTNSTEDLASDLKAIFDIFHTDMPQHINITKNSIGKQNIHTNMSEHKNKTKRSIGKQKILLNNSIASKESTRRWKIGKSTPEQFEIINMLWRKRKLPVDMGTNHAPKRAVDTTVPMQNRRTMQNISVPLIFSTHIPSMQTTTSSKIEFYYMDEKHFTVNKKKFTNAENTSSLPFIIFHLKGPFIDPFPMSIAERLNHSRYRNPQIRISGIRLKEVKTLPNTNASIAVLKDTNITTTKTCRPIQPSLRKDDFFDSNVLMKRAIQQSQTLNHNINAVTASSKISQLTTTTSSTIYDKIKFFEMYDKYTRMPVAKTRFVKLNPTDRNNIKDDKILLLEHIEQSSHTHEKSKHAKKHISEPLNVKLTLNNAVTFMKRNKEELNTQLNETSHFTSENTKSDLSNNNNVSNENETTRWSEYPFSAVYIYEPSQVHCDAAAINTHWLIASGACLSRVSSKMKSQFGFYADSQSAFVAYCGDQWWEPERVAYVKYTVVHPQYHPKDKTRQHLYNIGAVQVVNSMASACAGWAPVSLMSHQFVGTSKTTMATAVGWGLDRFDTRYGAIDLPRTPLMTYKSVVYFDYCPGNIGYSKAKRLEDGGGVWNVHCLSLPPYYGEDTDPVHGGLLLANGKFIAFYLQEERRPWGDQCAQYTGVWRLIPWLVDVAKEPEATDNFMFEL